MTNVQCVIDGGIATITVSRPEARNALNRETVEEIHAALAEAGGRREVGVVLLTGAGDKVFVSGADIRELQKKTKHDAFDSVVARLTWTVERFPKVTIAAVNGYALGGGCELALACDLRVAAPNAQFGFPEAGLGIIPAAGGTQRLPRFVGWGRAKELILTGEIIGAARAYEIGLVNRVAAEGKLMEEARAVAAKVMTRGPLALRMAKQAINLAAQAPLDAGLQYELASQAVLFESKDKAEGTAAFLEKRAAKFGGD